MDEASQLNLIRDHLLTAALPLYFPTIGWVAQGSAGGGGRCANFCVFVAAQCNKIEFIRIEQNFCRNGNIRCCATLFQNDS